MYKYKRGINDINTAKNMQFILTNGIDTCLNLSSCLEAKKIYNGMYTKKGKILLENLLEKVEIADKIYRVGQVSTNTKKVFADEFITSIDLEKNIFEYDLNEVKYSKRICFDIKNSDILLIEYNILNESNSKAKFSVIPFITYRDLISTKNSNLLKFNHRDTNTSTFINLSITNNDNLFLCSDKMSWIQEKNYLNSVEHEYIEKDLVRKIYLEDLYIPGNFEIELKPNESKKVSLYVSTNEFDINTMNNLQIFEEYEKNNFNITNDIADEFVELKEMAITMQNSYIEDILTDTIPYKENFNEILSDLNNKDLLLTKISNLIDIVKAIEGRYLSLGNIKEAKKLLVKFKRQLLAIRYEDIEDKNIIKQLLLLKLWSVESINRLFQKDSSINLFFDFIKDTIYMITKQENLRNVVYNNIELVSLYYNAIKIYQDILTAKKQDDSTFYEIQDELKNLIDEKFWIEEKRILKENLDDREHVANISMIYTLSLSYPILTNSIGIKLLDTIFKELYTPYGLRKFSKFSEYNDGLIYPRYMAYFVKANLRQNGVTRASQKIAYNLVKELLTDISKYINGGVRKVYSEKGVLVDSIGYDILTNAEVIRLYNMLT